MKVLPNPSLISRWNAEILDLKAPALHLLQSDSNSSLAFHLPLPASVFLSGLPFLEQLVIDVGKKNKTKKKHRGHWLNRYGCKNSRPASVWNERRDSSNQNAPVKSEHCHQRRLFVEWWMFYEGRKLFVRSPPTKKKKKKFDWSLETFHSKLWRKIDAIMIKHRGEKVDLFKNL